MADIGDFNRRSRQSKSRVKIAVVVASIPDYHPIVAEWRYNIRLRDWSLRGGPLYSVWFPRDQANYPYKIRIWEVAEVRLESNSKRIFENPCTNIAAKYQ